MRLQRALARAGVASRRHSEGMIAAGRVTVNGQPVDGTAAFEQAIAAARPAGRARLRVYNPQIEGYRMIALRLQ